MSSDVCKFFVSAPLENQMKESDFKQWCIDVFGPPDEDDESYFHYDDEEDEITPRHDLDGVQGLVYIIHSDSDIHRDSSIDMSTLDDIMDEFEDIGCDLDKLKIQSYVYYNGVDEPFRF